MDVQPGLRSQLIVFASPPMATFFLEQIGAVESVKAASDIYSPVSGVIESVNDQLGNEPGLLNKSPEDKGEFEWM